MLGRIADFIVRSITDGLHGSVKKINWNTSIDWHLLHFVFGLHEFEYQINPNKNNLLELLVMGSRLG